MSQSILLNSRKKCKCLRDSAFTSSHLSEDIWYFLSSYNLEQLKCNQLVTITKCFH